VAPFDIGPLSKRFVSLVTVCWAESLFAQVTVVPFAIWSVCGAKAKFEMLTLVWLEVAPGVPAGGVAGAVPYPLQPTTDVAIAITQITAHANPKNRSFNTGHLSN
jgi:hypothetical protein